MNKTSEKSQPKATPARLVLVGLGAVATFALLYLAFMAGVYVNDKLNSNSELAFGNNQRIEKLEFCLNRSIKPCNDQSLREWNKTHEDDQFSQIKVQDASQ